MVNAGGRQVFVERAGVVEGLPARTVDEKHLTVAIKNIARTCGDEISEDDPILDARLEDGSRVAAMFRPCSVNGPTLTIRRFTRRYSLEDLIAVDSVAVEVARAVAGRGGETAERPDLGLARAPETTLLTRVALIPDTDRIALIEDTPKLASRNRTICGSKRGARARRRSWRVGGAIADLLRARCGIVPIGSLWAKCGGRKRSISCRRSTPDTSAV